MNTSKIIQLLTKSLRSTVELFSKRNLHASCTCKSYEGEGKTTVTVLNKNFDYGLMIDNVSEQGFVLNNGIRTIGPMIIFPKTMLSWNIAGSLDMNEQSFSLFTHLEPKLDILVIGLDDEYPNNAPFLQNLKKFFKEKNIKVEMQTTYRACSTFNFLNSENRYAAGALIPPKPKYGKDLIVTSEEQRNLVFKRGVERPPDERDPLIPQYRTLNSDVLKKDKTVEEFLKVRSPWRPENKPTDKSFKNVSPKKKSKE